MSHKRLAGATMGATAETCYAKRWKNSHISIELKSLSRQIKRACVQPRFKTEDQGPSYFQLASEKETLRAPT